MLDLESASRDDLAVIVREHLMAGHLIDRAGMPYVIERLGRDAMRDVAIEEWSAASPIYTKRMQRAFGFEGDSVETIFKGMQFDVGAPPQFLDFRYALTDHDNGEFWLDHCGALADVEPMGEDFVVAMCHDIEDPTFDATACATNPRARVRPVHRPPRAPADRTPVCHWTVTISPENEPLAPPPAATQLAATRAATIELSPIDVSEEGRRAYEGPLLSDVRLADWSHSALVRMAEEICLQGHLLALAFRTAIGRRVDDHASVSTLTRRQFTGAAGLVARRLRHALDLGTGRDAVASLLRVHPALLPAQYTGVSIESDSTVAVRVERSSPGAVDGGWPALLAVGVTEPLDAIARVVDPRFRFELRPSADDVTTAALVRDDEPHPEAEAVVMAGFSTGAEFTFVDRGVPVEIRTDRSGDR